MSKLIKRIEKITYKSGQSQWMSLALCDCGIEYKTLETTFNKSKNPSCGCYRTRRITRPYGKEIYSRWKGIMARVSNTGSGSIQKGCYSNIEVSEEWKDKDIFYNWAIASGFNPTLHIDRIDGSGNYTKDNCRWITQQENNRNGARSKLTKENVIDILRLHGEVNTLDIANYFKITPPIVTNIAKGRIWKDVHRKYSTEKNMNRSMPSKTRPLDIEKDLK